MKHSVTLHQYLYYGIMTVCRFMLDLAIKTEGVIVTNDNYRDLYEEKTEYQFVIKHR